MKKFYSLFVAMFLLFIGAGTAAAQLTIDPGTKYYLMYGDKYVCESMTYPDLTDDIASAEQFSIEAIADTYTFSCIKGGLKTDESFGLVFGSSADRFEIEGNNEDFVMKGSYGYPTFNGMYFEVSGAKVDAASFHIVEVNNGGDNSTIPINFALHENGYYYTTFFSSKDWVVPECDGVYVITQIEEGNEINLGSPIAHKNDVVKGGTAVLIRSMRSGSSVIKEATSGTPIEDPAGNLLDGTDDDTPNIHADGYVYYILSKADGVPGFYYQKGCADGSYVNNGAHKAYLRLKKTNGGNSNGFTFRFDGNPTSVQSIATQENATIYNLQGQHVSGKATRVYVKNGKKFIVR